MPDKPNFRIGDSIIVNPGVMDPDDSTLSLGGWQGWVTDIYLKEDNVAFQWDSLVLRSIPEANIRKYLVAGLGWDTMGLAMGDVALATPRDTPDETAAVYEEIMAHHRYDYLADYNPGISDLLGPLGVVDNLVYLHAWEEHLGKVLRFPFEARVEEQHLPGPVRVGDIVQILGIADVDDLYGVLVNVRLQRRSYILTLCDLEATDHTSPNYQPLNDYVIWFANR